jgi:hypothetical protein
LNVEGRISVCSVNQPPKNLSSFGKTINQNTG